VDGVILFLVDIGEHLYRIERMVYQLLHAGLLVRQRAVLLGDFSGYELGAACESLGSPDQSGFDLMKSHVRSSPDRNSTEIVLHCSRASFVRGIAMSQERSLESIFTAVALIVLLLASPVIGIELGRLLGPVLR